MDDRIRISDADREQVTARLREHFAEGRLSSEELEQRITAALSARTVGDLRPILADLPEPAPLRARRAAPWPARRRGFLVRGPRILPLAVIALIAALVIPGAGWLFLAFFKLVLVLWLAACLAGIFAAARFRRHMRRYWQPHEDSYWQPREDSYWHQYQGRC